jgi:hypothetical protein
MAVDVTTKPIARIPTRSSSDKSALSPVRKYHFERSLVVINAKLALIAFSISQV